MISEVRQGQRSPFLVVLSAAALAVVVIAWGRDPRNAQRSARAHRANAASHALASPGTVFVQEPYMGVSCHIPNSIACDRIGLAVWLARRASVTVMIAGAPLRLDDRTWSYVARHGGKPLYVYAGFLRRAGITTRLHVVPIGRSTWLGADAPTPLVQFRIDYGRGEVVTTHERVWLHAGWG